MDYLLTLRCAKLIEVRPLLVCQRSVETLQRWLHDLDCLHNCQHLVDRAICLKKPAALLVASFSPSSAVRWISVGLTACMMRSIGGLAAWLRQIHQTATPTCRGAGTRSRWAISSSPSKVFKTAGTKRLERCDCLPTARRRGDEQHHRQALHRSRIQEPVPR
jgi:hypothetical protein